jgi:SAM-dependent methyltransferase
MRCDALEIDRFYRRGVGRCARDMALRRLSALWPEARGLDLLGLGYATPYLEPYRAAARRAVALMPAAQGALRWPDEACATALGEETRLPFSDALFDRIILAHALEEAEAPARLLREVWRVLAPEGRLMIVAAHRGGAWARAERTPFGHGRPFSRGQLSVLLSDALFEPVAWSKALYAPPFAWTTGPRAAELFENAGEKVWPAFGGLILAEAVKHVGAVRPGARAPARRRVLEAGVAGALSPARGERRETAREESDT